MYIYQVLDTQGNDIPPIAKRELNLRLSPAIYLSHYINCACQLLNGASEFNQTIQTVLDDRDNPISQMVQDTLGKRTLNFSTQFSIDMAPQLIFNALKCHAYFGDMQEAGNINHQCYCDFITLLQNKDEQTSQKVSRLFTEILMKFIVPGIRSIQIINTLSKNQQFIDELDIPIDQIPERFLCSVNTAVMDTPCYDKRNPDVKYEYASLCEQTTNPHTTLPLTKEDIVLDEDLKGEIDVYIKTLKMLITYKITPITITPDNLEKMFRRAAYMGNNEDIVFLLDNHSIDVNVQDDNKKRTALHWAIIQYKQDPSKHQECIQTLLNAGASLKIEDIQRKTPLDYTTDNELIELCGCFCGPSFAP